MQKLPQEEWQKSYNGMQQSLERLGRSIRNSKVRHAAPNDLIGYADIATAIIEQQANLINRLKGNRK